MAVQSTSRASRSVPVRAKRDLRPLLTAIIILLLIALLLLLYLYLRMILPSETRTNVPGINHIFSIYGYGKDRFEKPSGVAVDEDGRIYVSDTGNDRIFIFNPNGQKLIKKIDIAKTLINQATKKIGRGRPHPGVRNIKPLGIAAGNGKIFVASKVKNILYTFSTEGRLLTVLRMKWPILPFYTRKALYVTTGKGISIISPDGKKVLRSFGKRGRGSGQFDFPNGICIDKNGDFFVSDLNNMRVKALTPEMSEKWILGSPPRSLNDKSRLFGAPAGIAIGGDGNLYLVDGFNGTFHIISKAGKHIKEFGEWGSDDGQLYYPVAIVHVRNDIFLVADKFNDRIQELRITSPTGPQPKPRFGCGP